MFSILKVQIKSTNDLNFVHTSTNNKMSILNFTKIFVLPLFESDEMFKPTDRLFDFIEPKNLTRVLIIFHKILQVHWNQNQARVFQQIRDYLFGAESVNNSVL